MKKITICLLAIAAGLCACTSKNNKTYVMTAEDILGNANYQAMSYGGYRASTRDSVPSVEDIKEDMRILHALGIRIIRTYDTGGGQAMNLLKAINSLQKDNPNFEMYLMLGAWIECRNAQTDSVDHTGENLAGNTAEIQRAVEMAKQYPNIVKIIAVGNEAMVHWAQSYCVDTKVILKWVNYLQDKKQQGEIPSSVWITSSDNFAAWGGGGDEYHTEDLTALMQAVDFISMHTYPFHDSYYNPTYWCVPADELEYDLRKQADLATDRAVEYALSQYQSVVDYMHSLGINKPVHIGETGWATQDGPSKSDNRSANVFLNSYPFQDDNNTMYGYNGSGAADEYKEKLYWQKLREATNRKGISVFYFEMFDEPWKDKSNSMGSENHFGLIDRHGMAKYALWEAVDKGVFDGLTRGGNPIVKTFDGDENALLESILPIPAKK